MVKTNRASTVGRRGFLGAVGGTAVALGCARSGDLSRFYPQHGDTTETTISEPSPLHELNRRFVAAHDELRGRVAAVLDAADREDDGALLPQVVGYVDRLLRHHHAEEGFVFPAFRAAGRLRTSDVAFLDARDAEHGDVLRLCIELRGASTSATGALARTRRRISLLARELERLTSPHFAIEEATLTPEHLASLLTPREAIAMFDDIREHWSSR
jgi:hypothetical protein